MPDLPGDVRGADGVLRRRVARVLVLDRRGRVLLFHGGDPARPSEPRFWFPAGGGADAGESLHAAAVREVWEESGLDVTGRLEGPVTERDAAFAFDGEQVEQHEYVFLARLDLDGDAVRPDDAGWTDVERRAVVDQRWWSVADLRSTTDTVFPEGLADLLDTWC